MADSRDHITLIVVPDETAPVRRLRVSRVWLRYAPFAAGAFVLVLALGVADWVRLRADAIDVAEMREKTTADAEALLALGDEVGSLELELARVAELERKVRVIADLPAAMPAAEGPQAIAEAEPTTGKGGGAAAARSSRPAPDELPSPPVVEEPVPLAPTSALGLDDAALARIAGRAGLLRDGLGERVGSYETLVLELEGKSQQLAATPSIWPTSGWVTSAYGHRTSPFTGQRQFHSGLDIATRHGTDIVAPARGRVTFAGRKGPMGRTVVVDHGYGLTTTYGHAAELHVERGDRVERGQRLASVGSTGRSTGPHLHYSVALRGRAVNPANYILD